MPCPGPHLRRPGPLPNAQRPHRSGRECSHPDEESSGLEPLRAADAWDPALPRVITQAGIVVCLAVRPEDLRTALDRQRLADLVLREYVAAHRLGVPGPHDRMHRDRTLDEIEGVSQAGGDADVDLVSEEGDPQRVVDLFR